MIYLDVTSAATSSIHAGVQRTVRGLYRHLKGQGAVQPLRWDFRGRAYAGLSSREQDLLENPFAAYEKPAGIPGFFSDLTDPAALHDRWTRRQREMPSPFLGPDDTLLIPDLCWDSRIHAWPALAQWPGRRIAIFHDAMPLRIRGQANSKDELFAEYVKMLAQLDLIICVSDEVERDLLHFWREFRVERKPTAVLPWPMPFTGDRPRNPPNLAERRLIYVARLRLRKNHLVLLQACECLWTDGLRFSLDLVGMADAFLDTSKILLRVARLRASNRPVRWLKQISETELDRAYRECSLTVFPSQMEGFGLPIIESLWHRRPVICGSNGAIGEVAAGGGCWQVDQNNVVELAGAIRQLLTDASTYDRLYAEADQRTFRTWNDYGGDLDAVLKSTAAR